MKNSGKNTAVKGQANNTSATDKRAIRAAISSNGGALNPSKAFDQDNVDQVESNIHTPPVNAEVAAESKADLNKEPTKMEIKVNFAERLAEQNAILERHIKLGDELARKIKHRDNLKNVITTLNQFELVLKDDADETDSNYYQGCVLTIKDDNGKTFTTKNPTIIKEVAENVNSLCSTKLEEVELSIVNLIPIS